MSEALFHLMCIILNLIFYLVTGTLRTTSSFSFFFFFNSLKGTVWLWKIAVNKNSYSELLKTEMGHSILTPN